MKDSNALNDLVNASVEFPSRFIFVAQNSSSYVLCLVRYSALNASMNVDAAEDATVVILAFDDDDDGLVVAVLLVTARVTATRIHRTAPRARPRLESHTRVASIGRRRL
jgi:hypothetical protein